MLVEPAVTPRMYYLQLRESGRTVDEAFARVAHSYGAHWRRQPDYVELLDEVEERFQESNLDDQKEQDIA